VSAALPGQVDARLHVDGLELRGWTRYQNIRFTDRTLTAVVQSACNKPVSTLITHDHVRSAHGAWMAGPCRIPKLTVRVRFPSPAPNAKSVTGQTNSTASLKQVNAHPRPRTALVPLRAPLAILANALETVMSVPKLTVRLQFPSPAPNAKNFAAVNLWSHFFVLHRVGACSRAPCTIHERSAGRPVSTGLPAVALGRSEEAVVLGRSEEAVVLGRSEDREGRHQLMSRSEQPPRPGSLFALRHAWWQLIVRTRIVINDPRARALDTETPSG
jgi:hypothetical protein